MKQKRLQAICAYLNVQDKIIDVGCDHAYVAIWMARLGTQQILATDIHEESLNMARKNMQKKGLENKIALQLGDGLEDISVDEYDTLVIAGMGTSTIIHILADSMKLKTIKKIIIQSNNDLDILRTFMENRAYTLSDETVVEEKKHFYVVMKYVPGIQKLSLEERYFGLFKKENEKYYLYLEEKYNCLLKKVKDKDKQSYQKIEKEKNLLSHYIQAL